MSVPPIESLIAPYAGQGRAALLPALWDIQTRHGHISAEAVDALAHLLRTPQAEIYGVIAFYSLFHAAPTAPTTLYMCTSPSCLIAGGPDVIAALRAHPDAAAGHLAVESGTCLGLCEHAPAALISAHGQPARQIAPVTPGEALSAPHEAIPVPVVSLTRVLFREPVPDPVRVESLAEYGDYAALRQALDEQTPEQVIAAVTESGLVGRGGAAFPTGQKWAFTRAAPGAERIVICNADESEPGTFKDRALLDLRPHLVLEGMALAGYAVGATRGILFLRGEYPQSEQRLITALAEAQAAGLLGERIMGRAFSFQIELRRGAGAYICGEETALFEAIEGKRGFPRIKPPFPTTFGVFGQPTAINNVETLAQVPGIIRHGAAWFRQWGTPKSTGSKLLSVSGHVERPGVFEIPLGLSLRELLERHAGGITGRLQAVLMGGAAGTFLSPDQLDLPITFEDLRAAGSTLGSGAIMVFNDTVDLRAILRSLTAFFQHESCGKCYPCQLGTQRQHEIIARLGPFRPGDRDRLRDIALTMTESSLCGLGQTAGLAVLSALDHWPALFDAAPPSQQDAIS